MRKRAGGSARKDSGSDKDKEAGREGGGSSGLAPILGVVGLLAVGAGLFFASGALRQDPSGGAEGPGAGAPSSAAARSAGQRRKLDSAELWVDAGAPIAAGDVRVQNVSCSKRPVEKGLCGAPRREGRCARLVLDEAVPEADAMELRRMVEWLVSEAWGGGSGPPSVVDLHQGSISYKENFVELAALMDFKSITFEQAQKDAYMSVRRMLRSKVAQLLGVPEEALLHDLTFFSHINGTKEAKTVHDEYWHEHIDSVQYETFEYTTLLYLSTPGEDFEGGEFLFEAEPGSGAKPVAVEPRFNRLVVFTSDAENPHRVEKVLSGVRIALTAAFTCNREKAESIGAPFPPKMPEQEE